MVDESFSMFFVFNEFQSDGLIKIWWGSIMSEGEIFYILIKLLLQRIYYYQRIYNI